MHATYFKVIPIVAKLEYATKSSARRLAAAPLLTILPRSISEAFDNDIIILLNEQKIVAPMGDARNAVREPAAKLHKGRFRFSHAKFREIDFHVVCKKLEQAWVFRIGFLEIGRDGFFLLRHVSISVSIHYHVVGHVADKGIVHAGAVETPFSALPDKGVIVMRREYGLDREFVGSL